MKAKSNGQYRIRWRLRTKLLTSVLLLEVLLLAAIMLLVEQHLRRSLFEEFTGHGFSIAHSLAAVNKDYVTTYNYVKIDQHLEHIMHEHDLFYVTVLLFDGEVASYKESAALQDIVLGGEIHQKAINSQEPLVQCGQVSEKNICDISTPILIEGNKWATVRLGLSFDTLQSAIDHMRVLLICLGLIGLLVSALASILLSRRITKPVQSLMGNLQAIANGYYDQPIHVTTADEIGYFGHQFAQMQETLKRQFDLLEEKNDELVKSNAKLQEEIIERRKKESHLKQEISIRQKKEADLRDSEARLDNAQRIAKLGYWEWIQEKNLIIFSQTANRLVGISESDVIGCYRTLLKYIHPEDRHLLKQAIRKAKQEHKLCSVEHRIIRTNGDERIVQQEIEVSFCPQGQIIKIAGTILDITERKNAEKRIRYLAHYDSVTGLPNRAYLKELLSQWIKRSQRYKQVVAVLFLDLDHFKRINDSLGHSFGDELLRQVADRLTDCVRASDYVSIESNNFTGNSVARLGGDEFVIVLGDIIKLQDASIVAKRILHTFSRPFDLGSSQVVVTPSIGISGFPDDGTDVESLLKHADVAMYHAKNKGRNSYQFYSASMNAFMQERLSLEGQLRESIKAGHFQLYYQPKIATRSGAIVGMETLLRWNHPELGFISPAKFIPVAEETGLIVPLGEWVLRTACEQVREWQCMGLPPLKLAVNLSVAQFRQKNLIRNIKRILYETGLDPQFIELELTESMLMENVDASIAQLNELKNLGISLSIDDFGTGYSSLSYLKRFPIEALKIDQSFIREVTFNSNDAAIVNATIALGHKLGLTVVAEGVETLEQVHFLQAESCDQLQGYFYSKPLPEKEFIDLVIKHSDYDYVTFDQKNVFLPRTLATA